MVSQIIFVIILIAAILFFRRNVKIIIRNINLGKDLDISDNKAERWKTMFRVAIGQGKMVKRPIAGILHIFVYVGFLMVNFEMIEILTDGIFGTHRILRDLLGATGYSALVSILEFFALAVIAACATFLWRRNVLKIKRFHSKEMTSWPRLDANLILITEILLMLAFLSMNAADTLLMHRGVIGGIAVGPFAFSQVFIPWFKNFNNETLHFIEQFGWWFHIVGVFAFLNYIPYSKHFHVFLAFPNVWYSKLGPLAKMPNMPEITKEVQIMLGILPEEDNPEEEDMPSFGAKDVKDLSWKNIMNAYSCTECGRCTSVCPANLTGKLLSPRHIMMAVRDRAEEVGKNIDKHGKDYDDGKTLLGDYISPEELWACTSCNACVEECPVDIDPLDIILSLRRNLVLEESKAPAEINTVFSNIENNGAPWQFSPEDRLLWAEGLDVPVMADVFAQGKKPEYLFWVSSAGCFDDRYKKVVRDFVKIMNYLKVDFAVLGTEESDSGDVARRAGNDMLFQMQAMQNIEIMNGYEVSKIVTCDPHDFNVLKNEYPELGGKYEVMHHTQFLQKYLADGSLKIDSDKFAGSKITFHDPCYLGRGNGEFEAPREVLNAIPSLKVEMKKNREFSMCCGAGGGQMFKEAEEGDKEIFIDRTEQAIETGADIICTACPFCMTMMTDGIKYTNKEEEIKNYDIAELVSISLGL